MHKYFYERLFLMMNGFLYQIFFCIWASLFISVKTYAQLSNKGLENPLSYNDIKLKKVQFLLSSLSFVKNNEYFDEIADGYTLFGYYINPKITYQPHEKVQIEAGGFIRKEFGTKGLKEIEPTFTIQIKQKDWRFLFGNLEGNISHRMIEPLMSFERLLSSPLEHGIQAKYQKKFIPDGSTSQKNHEDEEFFDAWLDWQRNTKPGQTNQEYIWSGLSFYSRALVIKDIKLKGIAQLSIFHMGGQNIQSIQPVRTLLNPALGIRLQKDWGNSQSLVFDNYYVGYFESPYQGSAYYLNTFWKNTKYQAGLSYWFGHFFTSPLGNDLFQSQSRKFGNEDYYEPYRSLLIMRLARDWKVIDGLNISLRIEPHYDVQNSIFEHAEGLYLKYTLQK